MAYQRVVRDIQTRNAISVPNPRQENLRLALEVSGGFAVPAGLICVGLEFRQNTAAVQAATFENLAHASSAYMVEIATNSA